LIDAANLGYGKTRKKVNRKAENVAREKGTLRKEKIINGWWRRFIERQSQLSLRQAGCPYGCHQSGIVFHNTLSLH